MKKIALITLVVLPFFISCKKSPVNSLSSDKEIYSFVLPFPSPTPWVSGVINNDTITVKVPAGVSLVSITPLIQYYGKSISPAEGTAVNFTSPVIYTVTAEDGSTRRHVVIVSYKATTKSITDFRFRPSENAALSTAAVGQLINDSTIVVRVPASTNLNALVPTITHNGVSISPASGQVANFSDVVNYTVSAEDGSSKKYKVFVTTNNMVYVGSANGYLYALDAVSGQVKWSFNGGAMQMGSPIYYQGKVYVVVQGGGPLYCFDAATGAVIWTNPPLPSSGYGTPSVNNGTVYVGSSRAVSGFVECNLLALDANTGTLKWNKNIATTIYGNLQNPTAVAGYVAVTEFVTGLHVLDAVTGNQLWVKNLGINSANPLIAGGVVYIGGETMLCAAYDLATGNLLWQNNTVSNVTGSPVIANDVIYVPGAFKMYALNKTNGSVQWSEMSYGGLHGIGSGRFSSPSVSLNDAALYSASDDGVAYCLDLATGSKKWHDTDTIFVGTYSPSPVAANGMVVVNRQDNSLYAYSTKTGALIWKFTTSGLVNAGPCITDVAGNAYYTGNSGN